MEPQILDNLISEVTTHYLGHFLFIRSESQSQVHAQGEATVQEWEFQEVEILGGATTDDFSPKLFSSNVVKFQI